VIPSSADDVQIVLRTVIDHRSLIVRPEAPSPQANLGFSFCTLFPAQTYPYLYIPVRAPSLWCLQIKHIAPLIEGKVELFGYIDVVAELEGEPILVDYKTGGRPWKETKTSAGEIVVAKARGFQGPIYLTPPYVDEYFGGEWAGRMDYLYAPNEGVTHVYEYYRNDSDHQNLIRAATMIYEAAERGWFPKNQGWLCGNCDWYHVCYQTPNWERYHKEKHKK